MRRVGAVAIAAEGPVVRATIDRPAARNAIDTEVVEGLEAALDLAEAGRAKVLVLRGTGGTFCAGADLKLVLSSVEDPEGLSSYVSRLSAVTERLESGPFVSVSVVEGFALAGGCELLLACDVSIAATDARIGDRHLEYGLAPGAGGSVRLARSLTKARARYLLFSGEAVTGAEAANWGLVTMSVPPEELDAAAALLVERLATRSGDALRAVKRMLVEGEHLPVGDALVLERQILLTHLAKSADVGEGLQAFVERRPPNFG